ncbi:MinD/ParA family protein [Halobaculum sp. MBLA0147]|uniref:MinD/ParA family ATP-binding protein n=1 Tax=Halobaculum sp. MBLA0147 TaxID=3079934 RepID=UPI003523F360
MILAVCGGNGGVGVSTLAYEVAGALDAVVVDADLAVADLPVGRGPDLHDVLAGRAAPLEAIRGGPVAVLQCGRSLAGARGVDTGRLADAIRAVASHHDAVLDCPTGVGSDTGVPLAVADACVVVVATRRWAVPGAVRVRALADEVDTPVVAAALCGARGRDGSVPTGDAEPSTGDGDAPGSGAPAGGPSAGVGPATVRELLGVPVVRVPSTPTLSDSLRGGEPVTDRRPESTAAEAVASLAGRVERTRHAHEAVDERVPTHWTTANE